MYVYKLHTISHTKINLGVWQYVPLKVGSLRVLPAVAYMQGLDVYVILVVLESIHVYQHCFKLLCHQSNSMPTQIQRKTCIRTTCIYMYAVSFGGTCSSSRV